MSIKPLSNQAWEVALGFLYGSDAEKYIPLEDKDLVYNSLPPQLHSDFLVAWETPGNPLLTPYMQMPSKATYIHKTARAAQCVARLVALVAISLFVAPIGLVYNGFLSLYSRICHQKAPENEKNAWSHKIASYFKACFVDFNFLLKVFIPLATYKALLKAGALNASPTANKVTKILWQALTALLVRDSILYTINSLQMSYNPVLYTPDLALSVRLGFILKYRLGFISQTTLPFYHPPLKDTATALPDNHEAVLINCICRIGLLAVKKSGEIAEQIILELKAQNHTPLVDKYLQMALRDPSFSSKVLLKSLKREAVLAHNTKIQDLINQLAISRSREEFTNSLINLNAAGLQEVYITFATPMITLFSQRFHLEHEWIAKANQRRNLFMTQSSYQEGKDPNPTYSQIKELSKQALRCVNMYEILGISDIEKTHLTREQLKEKWAERFYCLDVGNGSPHLLEAKFLKDILELSRRCIGKERGWFTDETIAWWDTLDTLKTNYFTRFTKARTLEKYDMFNTLLAQLISDERFQKTAYELLLITPDEQNTLSFESLKEKLSALLDLPKENLPDDFREEANFLARFAHLAYLHAAHEKGWCHKNDVSWAKQFESLQLDLLNNFTEEQSPNPTYKRLKDFLLNETQPKLDTFIDPSTPQSLEKLKKQYLLLCESLDPKNLSPDLKKEAAVLSELARSAFINYALKKDWITPSYATWVEKFEKEKKGFLFTSDNSNNPTYIRLKNLAQSVVPPCVHEVLGISEEEYHTLSPNGLQELYRKASLGLHPDKVSEEFRSEANLLWNLWQLTATHIKEEKKWEESKPKTVLTLC